MFFLAYFLNLFLLKCLQSILVNCTCCHRFRCGQLEITWLYKYKKNLLACRHTQCHYEPSLHNDPRHLHLPTGKTLFNLVLTLYALYNICQPDLYTVWPHPARPRPLDEVHVIVHGKKTRAYTLSFSNRFRATTHTHVNLKTLMF